MPIGVQTASGVEWRRVDQKKDGGRWVKLGVFEMEAGDDYSVRISRETTGKAYVGVDAVKVERVSARRPASVIEERPKSTGSIRFEEPISSKGEEVVEKAREWTGTAYRLGGASSSGVGCSGLTMNVLEEFGVTLPHSDDKQYDEGTPVSKGQEQPGDLVFFDEHDDGTISHVGIYAGNGKIVHASDYYDEVSESDMEYIEGYLGARRYG